MKRQFLTFACLAGFLFAAGEAAVAGEVLDRIVATVNGHIILQSDWDDAVRYEAFIAGRQPNEMTNEERKAALDRLIDQELLREQMHASDFQQATKEEIAKRTEDVRKQYPGGSESKEWQSILARYKLNEDELRERIGLQINLMRLVEARLRPNVKIDGESIESYYSQELLPQLRQGGAKTVALAQVSGKIRELLTEQKVNQLLVAWLHNLRAGSEIHTSSDPAAPAVETR